MYETLKEMGITSPDEIERYSIQQEGDEDILKIYYRKQKGALFAHSTKFRHGRAKKMVRTDSGQQIYKEVSEISPTIQQAISELDSIVNHDRLAAERKHHLLDQIDHLEKVVQRKLQQMREEIESMD